MTPIQQKPRPKGPIKKIALVLAIIFLIALIASIVVNVHASGQADIFKKAEFDSDSQNSQVIVLDDLKLTILGTYQNTVTAFDETKNKVWNNDIAGAVTAMAYDTTNQWLIVGSQDRNIYVYSAADGALVKTISAGGKVYDLDFDEASRRIVIVASASASKNYLRIFDVDSEEMLLETTLKNITRAVCFSADKQYIFYGDARARVTKVDLNGEQLAQSKARSDVKGVTIAKETGDVYAIDENGNVFRFDSDLNKIMSVELVGEGRTIEASADGRWIGAGTREGDFYLLNDQGEVQFSTRQEYDVSQVYFGEDVSYVATLSPDLYTFSVSKLDNIGTMSWLQAHSVWWIAIAAFLMLAALIATFPTSSDLAYRFFKSMYRHRTAYLMLLPSIALILVFNYYNVFQSFYYAFTDWSLTTRTMREVNFIGFDNFVKMITEGYFLLGVKNLILLLVTSFLKLLTVPLLLAELVFAMRTLDGKSSRRRYWFRLLLVMPMVVPGVVSALMWKNIYDPNIGALNSILDVVGLSNLKHSWLGDANTAMGAIIFMGFPWVNSFAFLVFYGGLINIPEDLFEAAKVDGSKPTWNFFRIHLPLITPQLKMLIITTFISTVQDYGGIYLLTQGGPGYTTYVPGLELYYAATKFGQYGYACAMGLVMFIVILIGSMFNLRMKTQELG